MGFFFTLYSFIYFIHLNFCPIFKYLSAFRRSRKVQIRFLLCLSQNNSSFRIWVHFPIVFLEIFCDYLWSHSSSSHAQNSKDSNYFTDKNTAEFQSLFFIMWPLTTCHPCLINVSHSSLRFRYLYFLSSRIQDTATSLLLSFAITNSTFLWHVLELERLLGGGHMYLLLVSLFEACGFSLWKGNGTI